MFASVVGAGSARGATDLDLTAAQTDELAQGIVPTGLGGEATAVAQDAFLSGLHSAMLVGAGVTAVVAVLAAVLLRTARRHTPQEVVVET
ncbi:hypothetical protein HER21_41815, partial [Pseudomonas sp. BGM005]|nr:hypothetical protein [Pseudomonas sp. BG5]